MSIDVFKLASYLEEHYLPSARWWPWKGVKQRIRVVSSSFSDNLVVLLLESSGSLFHLPLIRVNEIPESISTRGFCIDNECFVEAEYTPNYLTALRAIEKASIKAVGEARVENLLVYRAKPITLESTNAVVEYETNAGLLVIKSYRKISEVNIEVKLLERLASSGYRNIPPVLGFTYYGNSPTGVIMGKVQGEADGGLPFYASLASYLQGNKSSERIGLASKLGVIIGEMHVVLNKNAHDPFFGVEPVTDSDVSAWSKRVEKMMNAALSRLDDLLDTAGEDERAELEFWRDYAEKTGSLVVEDALSSLEKSRELYKGRIHQDLHLAQMIYTGDGSLDFVITDFEGEPGRYGAERYMKEPLLRDVATMIRSFHYLSHAALLNIMKLTPGRASKLMLEKDPTLEWRTKHVVAMVYSYVARMLNTGLLSQDERSIAKKVWFYLYPWIVERAVYEFFYESHYRPSWISIPLAGLLEARVYKSMRMPW
ncbi:MAG: alpha-amylase [Desulfurococcaceae archaeon]